MRLLETHNDEACHDTDPVEVVRDNRAIGGRVCPTQDSVEDTPAILDGIGRGAALENG